MHIVESGKRYRIFNNAITTYDQLPPKTYRVDYDPETRIFSLLEAHDFEIPETKIYGQHLDKVKKVLNSMDKMNRNLGVILSGDKGIGKSLFSKCLGLKARKKGIPVILVNEYHEGIANFLEEIEQTVMILFDEYDKTFDEKKHNCQAEMLSLFDGVSAGKKLFVITCNEIQSLSQYLINRPGRFHYHFRFLYPTADEIRDYMEDKLDKQYYDEIENVIAFSVRMNLNYDCLRSIAFELNNGLKFQQAINDLNIIRISQYKNIKIIVEFENQATLSGKIKEWQLYDNTITDMSIYLPDNIRPLSYVGEYIVEFPMNFSNNYIDKDKRMLMFHVTNPEPEYDIAYTHESQDEEKTDEGKKITDILDKLYIGQKIKRIYAVPSDQKDKFRFF
ncbi:AAA family ATPase [Anaerostipes hadrus]|uniref:AAA family ATPase n=1 Tax=Anaerostipes hadrus TaxID=649756 RepID=UPI001C03A013|nr:AAA family ATPase [Anaerostipes hadrus]MBT9902590.1 AAA family ATPase [Anaerostipes hadrus]